MKFASIIIHHVSETYMKRLITFHGEKFYCGCGGWRYEIEVEQNQCNGLDFHIMILFSIPVLTGKASIRVRRQKEAEESLETEIEEEWNQSDKCSIVLKGHDSFLCCISFLDVPRQKMRINEVLHSHSSLQQCSEGAMNT